MAINVNSIRGLARLETACARTASSQSTRNGYSRLKGIFTRNINYQTYDEIVSCAKNKVIGNIPQDILHSAIRLNNKKEVILNIQNGFAQAADEISTIEKHLLEGLNHMNISKGEIKLLYKNMFKQNMEEIEKIQQNLINQAISQQTISKIEQSAAAKIQTAMKDVLPDGAKVKITYLSEGSFGKGYKIEFIGKDGQKVYKDRVLKVYKNPNYTNDISAEIVDKINKSALQLSEQEMFDIAFKASGGNSIDAESLREQVKMIKEATSNCSKEQVKEMLGSMFTTTRHMHGAAAEANSSAYISKAMGHPLHNTNLNKQDMFDLGHNFSISPFADDTLPAIRKKVNFERLNINATDIDCNESNTVAGRIIDFGGMQKSSFREELMDKVTLRYYKKIMNRNNPQEQTALIERLKQLCLNPGTPDRTKIEHALRNAEADIFIANRPLINPNIQPLIHFA